MSGDNSQRRPDRQFRSAEDLVRSILDLNDHSSTSNVSPSGELYRAIERYHGTAGGPPALYNNWPSEPNQNLQRRFSRSPRARDQQPLPGLSSLTSGLPSLPPLRLLYRTTPAMPSSNHSGAGPQPPPYQGPFRAAVWTSPELRAESPAPQLGDFLDLGGWGLDPASPPALSSGTHLADSAEDTRRAKRRKLDSDRLVPDVKAVKYGIYGQVYPGQLNMEIVSCDGGIYSEGTSYAAENILKNDNSVYCTKGNRCNIVLRHQGATCFSLKELIIKAPGKNYSSPVREGMVFVSMHKDELLTRTAQYQIQYGQPRDSSGQPFERESRSLIPVISIRHNDDGTIRTRSEVRQRRLYNIGTGDDEDSARAQIPPEFTVSPPHFLVTTECSDEDNDDRPHSRFRRRTPNRIGALPFESDNSSDDWSSNQDPLDHDDDDGDDDHYRRGYRTMMLEQAEEASRLATQEAVRAVGGELLAPHAKFHIEQDKNKCTIHFNPPVSGRFILLKMWNPHHDPRGNIDIQGVVANGFAGPRFFPAVTFR